MPATYTFPGVYVEEIPSGVRAIVGVATSNTAFIDFFERGPVNEPQRITSFGDFERVFGGLDSRSEASYAIQQYYLNGGSIAFVIRVADDAAVAASLDLPGGSPAQTTLTVTAANPGVWGDRLRVAVVRPTGLPTQFNLVVRELNDAGQVVNTESYLNLSMATGDPRYAVDVVNEASSLVRLTNADLGALPMGSAPTVSGDAPEGAFQPLSGGADGNPPDSDALIGAEVVIGGETRKTGLLALDTIEPEVFNLLSLPAAANLDDPGLAAVMTAAQAYCESKRAFLIVDIPQKVVDYTGTSDTTMTGWLATSGVNRHRNSAVYFPRLLIPDALNENRPRNVAQSGTLAGVYARTDATRGVWKAPAGTDATLRGARLAKKLTDLENGGLNPLGINVLRSFPVFQEVSWGARTLDGSDQQASEWKYIPVRRLALFIEETLFRGTQWVVFEPNDEPLWAQIRLNVGAFMNGLFRQGAFQGQTPKDAYFVKCDHDTNPQADINKGIVNIVVGFAPLKPAEFVIIKIQQLAGQIET
jgi:phage tail sheath protein FI